MKKTFYYLKHLFMQPVLELKGIFTEDLPDIGKTLVNRPAITFYVLIIMCFIFIYYKNYYALKITLLGAVIVFAIKIYLAGNWKEEYRRKEGKWD